jgi:hypothetical protein
MTEMSRKGPRDRGFPLIRGRRGRAALLFALVLAAAGIRATVAGRQPLEIDEVFSLGISTGHSLEHPAAAARPELGDFVQADRLMPATAYRRYLGHEDGQGIGSVIRAVRHSDIHPPGYYVMLHAWTRVFGTGDLPVRLSSILWSLACIPLLYRFASRIGGRQAGMIAATLIAFAPQAVYHGTVARMYAMVLAICIACGLATLELHRKGINTRRATVWILLSAAGLMTHYFFLFPWTAMCAWLLLMPHRAFRRDVLVIAALVVGLVIPWYHLLPELLEGWRVSSGWQQSRPAGFSYIGEQLRIPFRYILTGGDWSYARSWVDNVLIACAALTGASALLFFRRRIPLAGAGLAILWLASASVGLLAFDLSRGTFLEHHSRFAFPGIAAALTLLALALRALPRVPRLTLLIAILALWTPALLRLNSYPRVASPFRAIAAAAARDPGTSVLVRSIPSGVLGVARYLPPSTLMADWIDPLGTRSDPAMALALASNSRSVLLADFYLSGEGALRDFLASRAVSTEILREPTFDGARFVLQDTP